MDLKIRLHQRSNHANGKPEGYKKLRQLLIEGWVITDLSKDNSKEASSYTEAMIITLERKWE